LSNITPLVIISHMMLIKNKKATFNYEITDKFEAGIKLAGFEVKSLKKGQGSLLGAYVIIRGNEAFLTGANIPAYQPANAPKDYDPERPRRLLLNKKELSELAGIEKQKGLTIVPISVYIKGNKIKLEIGVGRGKKKHDKREIIKKRDTAHDIARELKDN